MMRTESYRNLSGLLLESPGGPIGVHDIERAAVRFDRAIGDTRWEQFVFTSSTPLLGEPTIESSSFDYLVVCRRSGPRILLMSPHREVVDHLLERNLGKAFVPRLRHVPIAVDDLVRAIVDKPSLYSLSSVHARVGAFGDNLTSVSYYGEDLGEAQMFRDQMEKLSFYACGLRSTIDGTRLIRLGSDGAISFMLTKPENRRIQDVEKVLIFLRRHHYLPVDVLPSG